MKSNRFYLPLVYRDISIERGKFTLLLQEDFVYLDQTHGKIFVPKGFDFDLMSVPQPVQSFVSKVGIYNAACVIHDWLYCLQKFSRKETDNIFRRALKDCGVGFFKRNLIYYNVRLFGQSHWDEVSSDNINWAKLLLDKVKR